MDNRLASGRLRHFVPNQQLHLLDCQGRRSHGKAFLGRDFPIMVSWFYPGAAIQAGSGVRDVPPLPQQPSFLSAAHLSRQATPPLLGDNQRIESKLGTGNLPLVAATRCGRIVRSPPPLLFKHTSSNTCASVPLHALEPKPAKTKQIRNHSEKSFRVPTRLKSHCVALPVSVEKDRAVVLSVLHPTARVLSQNVAENSFAIFAFCSIGAFWSWKLQWSSRL